MNRTEKLSGSKFRHLPLLFGIFGIALLIRLVGLKFGFPLLTHHDEIFIIDPLIRMSKAHSLDSGHYNKPTQITYIIQFVWLNLLSKLKFHQNMGWAYTQDPLFFYFYGRLVYAVMGAFIPLVAWKIGKSFKGIDFSLPAALLTCFYPAFVDNSHYIGVDVSITLFTLLIILFCLLYLQGGKTRWLVLACVMVSINTLEKYPGILSLFIPIVTIVIQAFSSQGPCRPHRLRFILGHVGLALGITVAAMFVIAPHLFIKWQAVRDVLIYESRSNHLGADNLDWAGNLLFYLQVFIKNGGWMTTAFALVGLAVAVRRRQPAYLLLFFGAGYWVALSKLGLHWERWSLPMVITPLLLAAMGVADCWQWTAKKRFWRAALVLVLSMGLVLIAMDGLTASITMAWPDTRVAGLNYAEAHQITPENTHAEGYSPYLARVFKTIFDTDLDNPGGKEYVILSSYIYGRYAAEPERYAKENAFYAAVREEGELVYEISPSPLPANYRQRLDVLVDYFRHLVWGTDIRYSIGPVLQFYKLH